MQIEEATLRGPITLDPLRNAHSVRWGNGWELEVVYTSLHARNSSLYFRAVNISAMDIVIDWASNGC